VPAEATAKLILADIDRLYPATTVALNRELSQILIAMNAPNVVARTIALLQTAETQEEQISSIVQLRNQKQGWNPDLRRSYLEWWNGKASTTHSTEVLNWFKDAGIPFNNGASYANFMANAHEEAKFTLTADEILALSSVLAEYSSQHQQEPAPPLSSRKLVQEWTTADLQPSLALVGKGRSFQRGRDVFYQAQCSACHRYGDKGGAVGPDLTAVATRFKRQDLLESSTEPSKVLSEQYMNTAIETKAGQVVIGRIVEENEQQIVLRPNPLAPETVTVLKSDIENRELSRTSPMPTGLLNTFSKDEILDLLAYLESLGDPRHPNFQP
jgi:putative heme-binding domain-containing protein